MGESYDDYIRTPTNIYDYDTIIDGDAYWNGDKDYDSVKSTIKDMDFTLLRSKYYSVEALIDLTERNFSLIYFTNILLYNQVDKSQLLVNLPNISTKKQFELVDVIIALYSISYIYYGAEDTILDSQEKIANILGFNMEADLAKIADHLYENHGRLSFKDLHVDQFTIPPNDEILSFEQLEEIYMTNKDILVHVREQMSNPALKKEIYDAYKFIYQSLFVMRCNMEYYALPNGEMATTYRQFLRYKDPVLYEYIQNKIASIKNVEARQTACVNAIQSITTYLKDYIDQDLVNLDDVFAGLPSISLDFIRNYVQEVVDFFKSFKIFTHDSSILYLFDDKFQNYVILRDWILLKYLFECHIPLLQTHEIELRVDNRSISVKALKDLETFLQWEFEDRDFNVTVHYLDSKDNRDIQMADYVANLVWKKYNCPKESLSEKIPRYDQIYLSKFPLQNFGANPSIKEKKKTLQRSKNMV